MNAACPDLLLTALLFFCIPFGKVEVESDPMQRKGRRLDREETEELEAMSYFESDRIGVRHAGGCCTELTVCSLQ